MPGAAGTGLCGGGWEGPHRPTVTTTLRHVPAYWHGVGGLAVARGGAKGPPERGPQREQDGTERQNLSSFVVVNEIIVNG
jgi:hypothetical protein